MTVGYRAVFLWDSNSIPFPVSVKQVGPMPKSRVPSGRDLSQFSPENVPFQPIITVSSVMEFDSCSIS